MNRRDVSDLRKGILSINPDVSHRATEPPTPAEIYTPPHHISALDPDNALVVGIRGVGKSFWAGALGDRLARNVAAQAYPQLRLEKYAVSFGFTGSEGSQAPSPETLQKYAVDAEAAKLFWRVVVLRSLAQTLQQPFPARYSDAMAAFADPEVREEQLRNLDAQLAAQGKRLLVVFDALDTLSTSWPQLRMLTKALLEVTYAMRSYRSLRLKLFLRPEQLDDPAIGFTDLSKLKAGKIDLSWERVDLYGLFFTRLANEPSSRQSFLRLLTSQKIYPDEEEIIRLPIPVTRNKSIQDRIFVQIAGPYMGSDHRKGKTYTWLPAHLADGFKTVTPRSFLTALRRAAEVSDSSDRRVLTIDGIKEGLRAASRVRVDQLKEEYKWIELALLPLAGLRVPCNEEEILTRWRTKRIADLIERESIEKGYLAPSEMIASGNDRRVTQLRERGLLATLIKIGVLEARQDGRVNMPDIFRIGAALIGRGRIAPEA